MIHNFCIRQLITSSLLYDFFLSNTYNIEYINKYIIISDFPQRKHLLYIRAGNTIFYSAPKNAEK